MSNILALGIWCPYTLYEDLNSNLNFQKTSEHCNHRRGYFYFYFVNNWMGGGLPINIKVTKSSERNNTTGKQNDWISGLSEYNHFFLFPAVIWII